MKKNYFFGTSEYSTVCYDSSFRLREQEQLGANTDVYISGFESNGTKNFAKYWRKGAAIPLGDGVNISEVDSIYVSGSDVYAAGAEFGVAKYWKNGIAVALTDGTKGEAAKSIFVYVH